MSKPLIKIDTDLIKILIFVMGLVGSSYPMKADVLTVAHSSYSVHYLKFSTMEKEIWKDIIGYEGLYQVSNLGGIKSLYSNIILKQRKSIHGYSIVDLYKGKIKKTKTVHRLLALAFIPNELNLREINHIDGTKSNNSLSNLEWCSPTENRLHAYENNLIPKNHLGKFGKEHVASKPIIQYDKQHNFIKEWGSIVDVENELGINHSNISSVCLKKGRITAGGFIWRYKNE